MGILRQRSWSMQLDGITWMPDWMLLQRIQRIQLVGQLAQLEWIHMACLQQRTSAADTLPLQPPFQTISICPATAHVPAVFMGHSAGRQVAAMCDLLCQAGPIQS
jgi:hypothetical protein